MLPETKTDYFFWHSQLLDFKPSTPQPHSGTDEEEGDRWWGCFCHLSAFVSAGRTEGSTVILSFFLIPHLCWIRISSLPVKLAHWKWTLSSFLSRSLDETKNRTTEVAETNKMNPSVWTISLIAKKQREIKSAADSWVDQLTLCPWWGPPAAWLMCCFWPWLSFCWKDIICIIEMEKPVVTPWSIWYGY